MAKRGGDREEENGINQIARNRVQRIYFASKCVYASGNPSNWRRYRYARFAPVLCARPAPISDQTPRSNAPRFVFILYPLRSTM